MQAGIQQPRGTRHTHPLAMTRRRRPWDHSLSSCAQDIAHRQRIPLVAAVVKLRQRAVGSSAVGDACPGPSTASRARESAVRAGDRFALCTDEHTRRQWKIRRAVKCERGITCMCTTDAALGLLTFSGFARGVG